jgi:transcriptional regulator with XRE-family HTH domain
MGLFFDQDWFDERLKAQGLSRSAIAQAAGMTIDEVEMVFRDQRELEGREVSAIARILRVDPSEVATRSGSADIGPDRMDRMDSFDDMAPANPRGGRSAAPGDGGFQVTREVIAGLHERMDRLESMLEMVLSKLDRR